MPEQKKRINPDLIAERGETGLYRQSGLIYEEFLRELQGAKAIKIFKEMSNNDAIIAAILNAIKILARGVKWRVDAACDTDEDLEAAKFIESCLYDMETTWSETIDEILSMLEFGWSWLEKVYKLRLGWSSDPTRNSKHNDGRIGWRKLPIRSQDTFYEWQFNEYGDVVGLRQQSPVDYKIKDIPREKSLLFRTSAHKNNPEGRSILRGAYRAWYMKKRLENIEAIGIERDLAGLPVVWVPAEIMNSSQSSDQKIVTEFKKILRNLRRDEQEGILMPLVTDEKGNKLYDITLLSTGSRRQTDTTQIVARYNKDIASTALADFILLGHENVGSFALASSKTDMFSAAIGSYLDSIAEVFNRDAIPELCRLNGIRLDTYPQLHHGDIETADLTELGGFITAIAGAGMELFPDDKLESYIRQQAGLPEKSYEQYRSDIVGDPNVDQGESDNLQVKAIKPAEPAK